MTCETDYTQKAYYDLLTTAEKRIHELDYLYSKQDQFRLQEIVKMKYRTQKRIDLQKQSGQLLTRIQLENVEEYPYIIQNPAIRRAVRAGNFAPHGSGCSLQATRHSACLVRTSDIYDSIRLTENAKTSSIVLGVLPVVTPPKKQPQELVLEHFKQQIEGQQDAHDSYEKHKTTVNPTPDDIKKDKVAQEFLASALLGKLTASELAYLVEQEKATHMGQSYRMQASGTHTISEWQTMPQTESFSPDHQSSPRTRDSTIRNFIPYQSAAQLLQSYRVAELQDEYNLLKEEQTHVSKSRKRVGFAPGSKGKYLQDDDSDACPDTADAQAYYDELDDFEQIDINHSNYFDDLTDFGAEFSDKAKKNNEISPSSQMIAMFEKLHGLE